MPTREDFYHKGFTDGLTCFAHWKDGKEYVGTQRTLLSEAMAVARTQWSYNPSFSERKTAMKDEEAQDER